jgi:hypothetical protein
METSPAASEWPASPSGDAEAEVYFWRAEQFRELGFSPPRAAELAISDADLSQARFLRRSGCQSELALRILR